MDPSPESPRAAPADTADDLNATSVALMRRVGRGDHAAFERLVTLHQSAVIGTAAKMLGNTDDAHDVAQMVFVKIWKAADRYEPTAKFTTWMFTILRNVVFNEHRKKGNRQFHSIDADHEEFGHELPDLQNASPDAAASQVELERAIDAAIRSLPEKQRLAVTLRRFEDMPYEDIAEILEISVSALKSLLFRARGELKEKLRGFLD